MKYFISINEEDIRLRFQQRIDEARLLRPRGPSSNPRKLRRQRASTRNDAALKTAGISRVRSRGMPKEKIIQRSGHNNMTTTITTHKTPENFIRANLPVSKQNKKGQPERLKNKERAFIAKQLKKQIKKAGGSSKSKIHDPEITANVSATRDEIEVSDAKERVKNLKKAASEVKSNVKQAGGKKGDIVSGHPASPHHGGDSGRRARQRIYATIPGAPKKRHSVTGKMMGKVK